MTSPEPVFDLAATLAELARLERAGRPLEPGASRRRQLRDPVLASAERFLRRIETLKAFAETDDKGARLLETPIGESGLPISAVLESFERDVVAPGLNPASGGHLAYVPGGGIYHSALGDYLAAVTNKYAGIFFTGPGPVRMEHQLIRWVADMVGYPPGATGNLASGGSIANLIAICTARDAHGVSAAAVPTAVVYLTSQAHHCIEKALRIAGLAEAQIRTIATDAAHRMSPNHLAQAIASDRASGLKPWLVIAAGGTTDTGAVDPLKAIGGVAKAAGCWFHVDAAYGGFFQLTDYGRGVLAGIEMSDSVVLDPHKSLFLPYGLGVVLIKDARAVMSTHHYFANYMQDAMRETEISPADVSPELTKHFRALRMWLPLKLLGVAPFRAALNEKLLLARYFRHRIAERGFEVGPPPDLSIVTFRRTKGGATVEEVNRINQAIVDFVRQDGRVFLSSTMLEGRFTIRLVALAFRTHRRTIDRAVAILEQARATVG